VTKIAYVTTSLIRDLAAESGLRTADFDAWLMRHDAEVRADERQLLAGEENT
jgi:hypothetical protein